MGSLKMEDWKLEDRKLENLVLEGGKWRTKICRTQYRSETAISTERRTNSLCYFHT